MQPGLIPNKPGERRGGRKKGSKNKLTEEVLKAVAFAFKGMGGKQALLKWGKRHPDLFYTKFLTRFIPQQMNLADADGQKLEPVRIVRIVAPVVLPAPPQPVTANGHHA